jgi:hypothetical protein
MAKAGKRKSPRSPASRRNAGAKGRGTHTQRENHPWEINIPDHAQRKDSPAYVVARKLMNDIVKPIKDFYLGSGPYQDHHGGGLWVKDEDGWLLVKNLAGIEWSQQFCADPAKVDVLRQYAKRIYARFPASLPAFKEMGFNDAETVLNEPIDSAEKVARWTDSIFNASVPLNQRRHTGVLKPAKNAKGEIIDGSPALEGGVHYYPTPITDIQLFKRDDFQLWVADEENQLAAVTPVAHGDDRVRVAHATPGTQLHDRLLARRRAGKRLLLPGTHALAQQAFAVQYAEERRAKAARAKRRKARSAKRS